MRNKKDEASSEAEDSGEETDGYAESEWDELDEQDFAERLAEMAIANDPIWIGFLTDCVVKRVKNILHVFASMDNILILTIHNRTSENVQKRP